jgi:transposase-like protein
VEKLKSVTVDFEHDKITYRPESGPERVVSAGLLMPQYFRDEYARTELPEGAVESKLKKQEAAGIPADIVRSERNIETIRSNMKTVEAKRAALEKATAEVAAEIEKFSLLFA